MLKFDDLNALYKNNEKVNFDQAFLTMKQSWQDNKQKPKILLHSCCAPCSTYVLEELAKVSELTIFFSNSNIHPKEEYLRRSLVQQKFIKDFNEKHQTNVKYIEDKYDPKGFINQVYQNKLEDEIEGGIRCNYCFQLRLDNVCQKAKELNFDYFGSALTLSPRKNATAINKLGFEVQAIYDLKYIPSDFKKRGGYLRSIKMCQEFDIYRQCYCGCVFSAFESNVDLNHIKCDAIKDMEKLFKNNKEIK